MVYLFKLCGGHTVCTCIDHLKACPLTMAMSPWQLSIHDPYTTISTVSKLLENIEEMFPLYHASSDVINRIKYSITHSGVLSVVKGLTNSANIDIDSITDWFFWGVCSLYSYNNKTLKPLLQHFKEILNK